MKKYLINLAKKFLEKNDYKVRSWEEYWRERTAQNQNASWEVIRGLIERVDKLEDLYSEKLFAIQNREQGNLEDFLKYSDNVKD